MDTGEAEFIRSAIARLHRHLESQLEAQVADLGFTLPQMRVLRAVVSRPGISIKDLSAALHLSQSTVSDIVERLVVKQTVVKRPRPEDRRVAEVFPTAAVERFMAFDREEFVTRPVRALLEGLSEHRRQAIREAFRSLLAQLETHRDSRAPAPP